MLEIISHSFYEKLLDSGLSELKCFWKRVVMPRNLQSGFASILTQISNFSTLVYTCMVTQPLTWTNVNQKTWSTSDQVVVDIEVT